MNTGPQNRVADVARDALEGKIGAIEAARLLAPMLHANPGLLAKDDFNTIIGIDSETDDLPIGRVRIEWDPGALAEKDSEIARCEQLWRDRILSVCQRLLAQSGDSVASNQRA